MAVREVLRLPDPVLTTPSSAVGRIDDVALRLAEDLVDTMQVSPACVGLAAPQIGVPLRAFVVDVTGHNKAVSCHGTVVLFDPEVLQADATRDGPRRLHERARPHRRRGSADPSHRGRHRRRR